MTPPYVNFISFQYEEKHLKAQKARSRHIQKLYEQAIQEASEIAAKQVLPEGVFRLDKLPELNRAIDKIVAKLAAELDTLTQNGIKDAWELSNAKNDAIMDHRLNRKLISGDAVEAFYNPNLEALEQFQARAKRGPKLSKRVWDLKKDFKRELEMTLGEGIATGKSAKTMATDAKQFLKDPNKLFRRVRDARGRLRLSKAAREYNPGQGVYRSSYKNALRATSTETNMAYRKADNERYKTNPQVIGYEVRLSNNHPKKDICDSLATTYPVSFTFTSWHPHCRCFVVPVLCSDADFDRMMDAIDSGTLDKFVPTGKVTEMPGQFTRYVQDHREMLNRLKNKPYWVRENVRVVEGLLG